jgi:hypothetical protein
VEEDIQGGSMKNNTLCQLGFFSTMYETTSWGKQVKVEVTCLADFYLLSGTVSSGHMYVELHTDHNNDVFDIGLYTLDGRLSDFDGVRELPLPIIEHLQSMGLDCSSQIALMTN